MKKYLSLLVVLLTTLFAANSLAFTPPPAPQKGWYVSDQTGRLSPDQINQLNQKIERVSKATKNEFGILLLQDMGGDNIEDVANSTFKAWGIGKRGLDNGCLIVVALKEHKSRIETGKGVEGEVTDLQANDILKKNLNPHLKRGDFAGGFSETLDALSSLIESRHNKKADPPPASPPVTTPTSPPVSNGCDVVGVPGSERYGLTMAGILLGCVALILGLRSFSRYRARKETERLRQLEMDMAAKAEARAALAERTRIAEEQRAKRMEDDARRRAAEAARQHAAEVERRKSMPPPPVPTPPMPKVTVPPRPTVTSRPPPPPIKKIAVPVAATVVASAAVLEAEREARAQREREEAKRERDEEDERRRKRDSESSSSFWDSGSSSGGGFDSGGGFGGGDSGGGGSSSDW